MTRKRVFISVVVLLVITLIAIPINDAIAKRNSITIGNQGSIASFGVTIYWDSECTDVVSSINWGNFEAGSSDSKTVYVKNIGNKAISILMNTMDWEPSAASDDISLDWNYNGQTIESNASIEVTLTLTIASTISEITTFAFDIIISRS